MWGKKNPHTFRVWSEVFHVQAKETYRRKELGSLLAELWRWPTCSSPNFPDLGCPSFDSYLLEMWVSSGLYSTLSDPYFYFRILTHQSSGTVIQHGTSCLSGTCRLFRGLRNILIWVLASLNWAQGQSADLDSTEGEETTPHLFPLPNSSWVFFFFFSSLIIHRFLLWLSPFNLWTIFSILLPLWYWVPSRDDLDKLWAYCNILGCICIEIKHKCRKAHVIQNFEVCSIH